MSPQARFWDYSWVALFCNNTTRSSTGKVNGACTLLEERLGWRLLHLACRHHIHELIIGKAFEVRIPEASNRPNIKLFQRFSQQRTSLNPQQIEPLSLSLSLSLSMRIQYLKKIGESYSCSSVINSLKNIQEMLIKKFFSCCCFLWWSGVGDIQAADLQIWVPGAYHSARWMANWFFIVSV